MGGGNDGKKAESAKDIFAVTSEPIQEAETTRPRAPGRPAVHGEDWTKVAVVLFNRQIAYLDRLAIDLRLKNGCAASRAEIIRALVDALADSGIELADVRSEDEVRQLLATTIS